MKNLNNKLNKIFNQFFILGMIISAGIIYLSEAIFKNVIFFTSINMPKTQFILGTFFVISALTYFFIIRDFDKEIWAQSIKRGYLVGVCVIILTQISVMIDFP